MLTYIEEPLTIANQPDILGAMPAPAFAYQLNLSEQTELTATATFLKAEDGSENPHIYRRDDIGNWILIDNETVDEETVSAEVKLPGNLRVAIAQRYESPRAGTNHRTSRFR